MSINSINPSAIAKNAYSAGENRLTQYSQDINNQLIRQSKHASGDNQNAIDYDALALANERPAPDLADSLVGIHMTEQHMKSLIKVIEVEKNLFDQSMGKIFDSWA